MRLLVAAALAVAVCGAAFGQAEDSRPQLQSRLIAEAAAKGYGTEGSQFGLDQGVPEGKSVRYAFALNAGETYFVAGGCDKNCTSMALLMTDANSANVAYTEDGEIVAHTPFDGTTNPTFTMTAAKTTTYSIVINVAGCHGPQNMCVAGAAVFRTGAPVETGWVRTDDFTIDPQGTIVVSDSFSDETFCVLDMIDDDTGQAAADALAKSEWPKEIDAAFKDAVSECDDIYDWAEAEGDLALVVSTTQILLNRLLDEIDDTSVDYDAIVAIQQSLLSDEAAKFMDGSWLKDSALVGKLQAGLKARGIGNDASAMNLGETAVGAYSNQVATIRRWVEMRTPR
jgi:hypothetical protein